MLTTSLSKDLYKTFLKPDADDRQLLIIARATAVVCSLVSAGLAIWFGSVFAALKIFYTLLSAALLLPVVAGLYSRWVTARIAIATMLSSVAVTFVLEKITDGKGKWGVPSLIFGIGVGALVMLVARLFTQNQK